MPQFFSVARFLDLLALVTAALSAWLWWRASQQELRRVAKGEEIDARDINRIITGLNRAQILNRRAALATAASALVVAVKFGWDLVVGK